MFNKLRFLRWYWTGRRQIRTQIGKKIKASGKLKVILGSGATDYPDWIATDLPHFDIVNNQDWNYFFGNHQVDNFLAEHVLEHLTADQVKQVLTSAFNVMKPGAVFRIAVPDAYHPDPKYIEYTQQGHIVADHHGHLSSWDMDAMSTLATTCGFKINLLEYHDRSGILFPFREMIVENGQIIRHSGNPNANSEGFLYSSLIVDLVR